MSHRHQDRNQSDKSGHSLWNGFQLEMNHQAFAQAEDLSATNTLAEHVMEDLKQRPGF